MRRKHVLGSLGALPAPARQAIMLHALYHLPLLVAEDPAVVDHLRLTPFVDTKSGKLHPPGVLYDPRCWSFLPRLSMLHINLKFVQ